MGQMGVSSTHYQPYKQNEVIWGRQQEDGPCEITYEKLQKQSPVDKACVYVKGQCLSDTKVLRMLDADYKI